jgi:hypothetical protein
VDADTANTANKVVVRDGSGNFSAGTITASLSGNATTATTATTANATAAALTAGTYLTSGGTFNGSTARTFAVDATTTNTASKVVARDASGNFSAGTITATLNGNASTATSATTAGSATTATTATNATNVALTTSSTSSAFKVPFANTTASTTGNYGLLQDSEATFTYNPSTNTLTAGTFSGALSGNATSATTATTATNLSGGTVAATTITATTSIMPVADNTGVIGDATTTWSNGQFTNLSIDSTLTVRAAIDLADSDVLRMGSSDDWSLWYNGSTNKAQVEMEAACLGIQYTNNTTEIAYLEKSTGTFQAKQLSASNGIVVNSATISESYSIPSGSNAMSAGPITVANGVTVTIPDGNAWVIV